MRTAYTTNLIDFSVASQTALFGTAANHTTAAHPILTTVNVLWGGNANFNTSVRYGGPSNDKDYILGTILLSVPSSVLSNIYSQGDLNMNRVVRYGGPLNDKDFLLATPLSSLAASVRNQALPL